MADDLGVDLDQLLLERRQRLGCPLKSSLIADVNALISSPAQSRRVQSSLRGWPLASLDDITQKIRHGRELTHGDRNLEEMGQ